MSLRGNMEEDAPPSASRKRTVDADNNENEITDPPLRRKSSNILWKAPWVFLRSLGYVGI